MPTKGFRKLSRQLKAMERAPRGKALRSAAMGAMLPALQAARAAAPQGNPPYTGYSTRTTALDPYPRKTYKGRVVSPGFTARNIGRKSFITPDKNLAVVILSVRAEAFEAVNFIELGTSSTPKKPWLEPSFKASIPAVNRRLRAVLKKNIDRAIRK